MLSVTSFRSKLLPILLQHLVTNLLGSRLVAKAVSTIHFTRRYAAHAKHTNKRCFLSFLHHLFKSQTRAVLTRYKLLGMERGHSRHCTTSGLNPRGIGERRGKLASKVSAENHELAN
ncbi:Uncharacterized protein DBV15_00907 [Temnothorax longispinosus]|uniref:Uncharacterized protein n=1 Tax=Temnothorax longispinosus TaxID=300112 RepID=A0A4V3S6A6_9HYME|nr:Uncharacterized protein DBV15_00907 [Temnothorax longispinosus]